MPPFGLRFLACAFVVHAVPASSSGQGATIAWTPFTYVSNAGDSVAADSARVIVPESRAKPDGAKIQLAVVRIRSTAPAPGAPIIFLAGGPGAAGIRDGRYDKFPTVMALASVSDVILFDQRGTGETLPSLVVDRRIGIPLDATLDSPEGKAALAAAARAAVAEVRSRGIDLQAYNTAENADDIDDLRRALGADRIILWGHSYGSHLAFAYLERHDRHAERVIVGGINGLAQRRRYPRDGDVFLTRIDSIVRATPRLDRVMPDFLGATRRVLDRLAAQPAHVRVGNDDVVIGREDVRVAIALQSNSESFVRSLPLLVGRMDAGDYQLMARSVAVGLKQRQLGTVMAFTMDLASGVDSSRMAEIRREVPDAILGDAINFPFDDPAFVAAWGVHDLGPGFRAPVRTSVPTLFISGTLDGRTSLDDAEEVRKGFTTSAHVVVDGASHVPYSTTPALRDIIVRFAKGKPVASTHLRADNVELRGPDEPAMIAELREIALTRGAEAAVQRLRALAADSSHYLTSYVVGSVSIGLARQDKRPDDAATILLAGLELFPSNSFLLTQAGAWYAAKGDNSAALGALTKAVAADPFNQEAAVRLRQLR